MTFQGPSFVLAIIAMSYVAWIITTAIRARHGYPLENEMGKTITKDGGLELKRQNEILERENEMLRGKVGRLEERMSVLERIATDTPTRLTAEIDKLRD
jgi:cell division protein FtsB